MAGYIIAWVFRFLTITRRTFQPTFALRECQRKHLARKEAKMRGKVWSPIICSESCTVFLEDSEPLSDSILNYLQGHTWDDSDVRRRRIVSQAMLVVQRW